MTIDYNLEELDNVAQKIITHAPIKTILFYGEVGAGKTTLIKAIVKALKSNDNVSSPTFSLVNEYVSPKATIYHFDLYRIEDENELFDIGIETYLENNHWKLIEWPEKIIPFLNSNYIEVTISNKNDLNRTLTIETFNK